MASLSSFICSVDGCKRGVTCLCRHCQKDVCSKHFNEHQVQVNNQLIPLTDRLNELKMQLRSGDQTGPMVRLEKWRDKKHASIDEEYNRKVKEFKKKLSKQDEHITQTITQTQQLVDEGDVSIDQIKQIQKTIDTLNNQINNLMNSELTENINESNLVGTYIHMGGIQYLVKARIKCSNTDLYALESERPLVGYNGLCPRCNKPHVLFENNRGFYVLCETLHTRVHSEKKE